MIATCRSDRVMPVGPRTVFMVSERLKSVYPDRHMIGRELHGRAADDPFCGAAGTGRQAITAARIRSDSLR